jgi:hypothetical protein
LHVHLRPAPVQVDRGKGSKHPDKLFSGTFKRLTFLHSKICLNKSEAFNRFLIINPLANLTTAEFETM